MIAEISYRFAEDGAIKWDEFNKELTKLINRCNIDGITNTPDFILSEMILGFILRYGETTNARDKWFGFDPDAAFKATIPVMEEKKYE